MQSRLRPEVVDENIMLIIGVSVQWLRNNRRSPSAPPFSQDRMTIGNRPTICGNWVRQQDIVYLNNG